MSDQPDYTQKPFAPEVHQERSSDQTSGLDQNTAGGLRGKLIESIIQVVVQAITGVFLPGPVGAAFTQLATWAAGVVGDIGGLITSLLTAPATVIGRITDVIIDGFGGTVGNFLDGIVNGFLGLFDIDWGTGDANSAAQSQAATTAALSAAIAAIQQQLAGGTLAEMNFNLQPDSNVLPSVFTVTMSGSGAGTWGVLNGVTDWYDESGSRTAFARYNVAGTDGDNQLIGMVCASVPEKKNTFAGAVRAHSYLRGRMNTSETDYIQVEFTRDTVELSCFVAGAQTVFDSADHTFKANNAYYLRCGTTGNARTLQVLDGATPLINYTDVSNVSSLGASFRNSGLGANRVNFSGSIAYPARVAYWAQQSAA